MQAFLTAGSLSCAYETSGTGPALVLLHGWGQSHAFWANIMPRLAQQFTVYSIDLPGFGASQEPPDAWGVEDYADFVHLALRELGLESPMMMGHSFGGKVTAYYASRYPTSKIILYSASGLPTRSLAKMMHGYLVQAMQYIAPNSMYRLHSVIFKPAGYHNVTEVTTKRSRRMLSVYLQIYRANIEPALPDVEAEVLLLYGKKDGIVPYDVGTRMAGLLKKARLVTLDHARHFAHFEAPDIFMGAVERFLAPHEAGAHLGHAALGNENEAIQRTGWVE